MTKEEIMALSADEIEARKAEIDQQIENDDGALAEQDLITLLEESRALNKQLEELRKAEAEKIEARNKVAGGAGNLVKKMEEKKMEERTFGIDTVEYRDAYLKNLMGKDLTAEERAALTSAGAVIPTEMQNKIWEKLRENPLIAELDLMHIPGYVTLPKESTTNNASWVAMDTASNDSADVIASVTLGAKKLIKTIEITADIQAMSIPAFQAWLTNKLVEKCEAAICAAVINGAGSATVPQGVMAAAAGATAVTKAITIAGLSDAMASLPSGYHRNAVWVMSAATFYGKLVPLAADNNGVLVMNGIEQRFLGHKVVLDENAAAKVIFGDFHNGYAWNFGSDIKVDADESVAFRTGSTVYRAMALCDGIVVQGEAFVVVTASA